MKKQNNENLITRKIKYSVATLQEQQDILMLQKQYSNVLHFTYNRLFENNELSTKELTELQKKMKNIEINSHLKNSAIYDSKALIKKDNSKQIIFGGKKLFLDRQTGKISKNDYKIKRLSPIFSIGEANQKGNRLFDIIDDKIILFKPSRDKHILLNLKISKHGKQELLKLKELCNKKKIAITITLNQDYICLTFDFNKLSEIQIKSKIQNRIFAIDQNPNYLGWSIIDWKNGNDYKIIDKGVISLKLLNDKWFELDKQKDVSSEDKRRAYITNKRRYEVCKIGQYLVRLANHYQCEIFSLEELKIKNSNKERGKHFNSLCNNLWCRGTLYSQLRKYCNLYDIYFLEVTANYSSFIGNLVYREEKLPDMILASIEISRRGYEFYNQYISKTKDKVKNIVLPKLEFVKDKIVQSLEELNLNLKFENLVELYNKIKKSKQKYRFLLEDIPESRVLSKNNYKSYVTLYSFL